MLEEECLSKQIIGYAISVHKSLGHGLLEKVYENALCYEFKENGIPFDRQKMFKVIYKDHEVGEYYADLVICNSIILELKSVNQLNECHVSQLIHYLKISKLKIGYLLNFGSYPKLEFKRIVV